MARRGSSASSASSADGGRPGAVERHRGKPAPGKHAENGLDYEPATPKAEAAALAITDPARERKRPATSRYPIDMDAFATLKGRAIERAPTLAKGASALAIDTGKALDAPAALAAAPPGSQAQPAATPVAMTRFEGIRATGWLPPDCTMAVGPQDVLLAVNGAVAVFAKSGGSPRLQRTLNQWFANVLTDAKIFDPKAAYDQHAGRWVLLAVALPNNPALNESYFLLSVSRTTDPLGGWYNYKLDAAQDGTTPTNHWADYPAIGLDHRAFYLTANMFRFGGPFRYAKLRIIPKAPAYAGSPLTFTDLTRLKDADGAFSFTVQPCHTFGAPNVQHFVNSQFPTIASPTRDRLTLWSLTDPLGTPVLTKRSITTDPYGLPPDAPQKGGAPPLDSGDVRVLNAVFRGGSVWAALTTAHDWGDGDGVAACHWFQANATSGALIQQGVYGARKAAFFYPAVMPDTNGNLTMVFCRSAANQHAGIRFTGRRSTDPLGTLQPSALLQAGAAHYVGLDGFGRNRWGDYAGIAVDPEDGRRTWFYSMYAAAPANTWGTWVGSSRF